MPNKKNSTSVQYKGVMVSSTFIDLELHRKELMRALRREELFAIGMEEYVSGPEDDIISSSLEMVQKSSAYIGLISRRYGQIVECPIRNPNSFSISRLEFEEAQRLGLPTLIFIMGEDHTVKEAEVEIDPIKREKLKEYRERAKQGRIYVNFNNLEGFTKEAIHNISKLAEHLAEQNLPPVIAATPSESSKSEANPIPVPPAFYPEPSYIGSHNFVGRRAELDRLSDWAVSADPHPILLFEAIGGTGKSMLTWEWTTKQATKVRQDWAGIFWYSFYEKGAIMTDFCQRALAYITGQPLETFRKKKIGELSEHLLRHLQSRPWLFILDGLERVLVAYHRFDAAQIADDQVEASKDPISDRDPCAAIRPEDDDLLRTLAAATPSKILITTRLTPRVLLSPSNQGIQGVQRVPLPGLRPGDAEELIRSCGITGTSKEIQNYLKTHCDCHPLVIGVLAGLINEYFEDRGNFDAWASDSSGAGRLNFADLNLVKKRNHILLTAIAALPDKSRQLLSTLALLSESADSVTLRALNPHLPPEPEKIEEPQKPEDMPSWKLLSDRGKKMRLEQYKADLEKWETYERLLKLRQEKSLHATRELSKTVSDLERRGLLQYDRRLKYYDLHPVVRGVAADKLGPQDKEQFGQRVADHFSQRAHTPYEEAETIEDVKYGMEVVRAYIHMGRYQQACNAFIGELSATLLFNLEANSEILSIGRSFFTRGWNILPDSILKTSVTSFASTFAIALLRTREFEESKKCYIAIIGHSLEQKSWTNLSSYLRGLASVFSNSNRLATANRVFQYSFDIDTIKNVKSDMFLARLHKFGRLIALGHYEEANAIWQMIDGMDKHLSLSRSQYRPGTAEEHYAYFHYYQGSLTEEILTRAEDLARNGKNRPSIRSLYGLRGYWKMEQGLWSDAVENFQEAIRMGREVGQNDLSSEAGLCLSKFQSGEQTSPEEEAERLAMTEDPPNRTLTELWLAIGNLEQAKKHALAAYKSAWADGEPYVFRHRLNKAIALLERLGSEIPTLPDYDPLKEEKLPWEDEVKAYIEELRAKKLAKKNKI